LAVEALAVPGVSSAIILADPVPASALKGVLLKSLFTLLTDLYGVPFYSIPP